MCRVGVCCAIACILKHTPTRHTHIKCDASGKVRELTADGEQGTAKFKTLSVMNENHGGCVAGLKLNTGGGSWDEKKEMLNEVQS